MAGAGTLALPRHSGLPVLPKVAEPPAVQVSITGTLLQAAELRVVGGGPHITLRLLLAQPGALPPVQVLHRPEGGMAAYIAWRQQVHNYARGVQVRVEGHGLRAGNAQGRRIMVLEHATRLWLLQAPFDARAAAAGDGEA